jgi:PadR family transcriptional regulator, regulatory protein PadR
VTSRREFSPQTLSVLAALCEQPSQWQHGYALASQTGLKSGTLYPILIRLADRGLVEACWQEEPQPGRPRRHLYRLTPGGLASASGALAALPQQKPSGRPAAGARQPGGRGVRQPIGRGVAAPAVR